MTAPSERQLPHDDDAERAFLGAILVDPTLLPRARELVQPKELWRESHRAIYRILLGLGDQGTPIDFQSVNSDLLARDLLEKAGGAVYVSSLADGMPKAANIAAYARPIRVTADRRALAALGEAALNGHSPEELAERVTAAAGRWTDRIDVPRPVDLAGVEATFPENIVPGLIRKSGLHLVWAEPSAGKTYLLLRWMLELLSQPTPEHLCGHPDLPILEPYYRVLWIGTEEDSGILRARMDRVMKGLGNPQLSGELMHLWASASGRRVTLDDLPALLRREGPVNAVVLDSLTGLRPKTVNGERVKWDLDNDAANETCLALRGLSREHDVALFLVHHTGRDTGKGYRGPTDWWASADIQLGILPEGPEKLRVKPEKNREGRRLDPFVLTRSFDDGAFTVAYHGAAADEPLSPSAERMDGFLRGKGTASQAEIAKATGIHRNTAAKAAQECIDAGLWRYAGERQNNSPVFIHIGPDEESR